MTEDFHVTLHDLRSGRDRIEQEFDALLSDLDGRVAAARAALEHAAELAAAVPGVDGSGGDTGQPGEEVSADHADGDPGVLGRVVDWLIGGRLSRLERRQVELAQQGSSLPRGPTREHVEAVRELAGRAAEAVEAAALTIRRSRDLLNAKEAETVHVASHGARAQTELTLQELARQQEALLAELVGRRAHLEELVASLSGASD